MSIALRNLLVVLSISLGAGMDAAEPVAPAAKTVTVVNRDGKPMAGISVSRIFTKRFDGPHEKQTTGQDGAATFADLRPTQIVSLTGGGINFQSQGELPAKIILPIAETALVAPDAGQGPRFRDLARKPGDQIVIVKTYDGAPIPNAVVTVDYSSVLRPPQFRTDEKGEARVKANPGFYALRAEAGGASIALHGFYPGDFAWPVELRLPAPLKK